MKKKEAVYYWENLRKTFSEYAEKEENIWAKQHYQFSVEAIDAALDALKMSETGEPLTLEQLCKIEGKKVLIYRMKSTEPLEPGTVKFNGDVLGDNGTLAYHELYLLTWVAFSYPTAHIDREAWTGCTCNTKSKSCCKRARMRECPDVVYTNGDKMRDKSDEELAVYFSDMAWSAPSDDPAVWLEWLRKPAEGE